MELKNFLKKISENNLDYYLLATKSEFDVEYLPDHEKDLERIIGFDGSNGFCFLSEEKIIFITDGRYILQAEKQLSKIPIKFEILNLHEENFQEKFDKIFFEKNIVGYNSKIFTKNILKIFENKNIFYKNLEIKIYPENEKNIINKKNIFLYDEKYCGLNYEEKILKFSEKLKSDYYFFNCPSSICWLLNIRGEDISHNLIFLCYGIFEKKSQSLEIFCDDLKKLEPIKNYKNIKINSVKNLETQLKKIISEKKIISASDKITIYFQNLLGENLKIEENYCNKFRSIKEKIEIENSKKIHLEDGIAFINFWYWLENEIQKNNKKLCEISITEELEKFRKKQKNFFCNSFDTISALGENGAIIHYRTNSETNKIIDKNKNEILLIDSGGHYFGGTTDITRVLFVGENPSDEQKKHYTLVLKSHLKLINSIFPKHIQLHQLNSIARYELWQEKFDFNHGLGHGVSNFIEVHESPYSINSRCTEQLIENLILSNEPGIYIKNKHGIRIENLIYSEIINPEDEKHFIQFKNLTMIPYDLRLVDFDLLTNKEISQIDKYHKEIYEKLSKDLDDDIKNWLKEKINIID